MRPSLFIFLSLTTAISSAQDAVTPPRLPAISLLPNGSQLKGVLIPRHDDQHRLVGSLKASIVTLVNAEEISGKDVVIDFFNDNGSPRGRINLALATFNQPRGIVTSSDPVAIDSETFHARGTGLHYAFQHGDGFLKGPATTWIKAPTETTMKPTRSSIIGAAGLALMTQSATVTTTRAAETDQPTTVNMVDDTSAQDAQVEAAKQLAEDRQDAVAANTQVRSFLNQADLDTAKLLSKVPANPDAKPLDVEIGDMDTVIACDGGMYFDADKGLLVYLKNVSVKDPRFELGGANELKILLSRKSEDTTSNGDTNNPAAGVASFDEVERIIATGAVTITQRSTENGKAPVKASGAIFTFRPKTGEILLSGGYPWVQQGSNFMRAKEPNLTLRIRQDGSFVTEGSWEMGGTLNTN